MSSGNDLYFEVSRENTAEEAIVALINEDPIDLLACDFTDELLELNNTTQEEFQEAILTHRD